MTGGIGVLKKVMLALVCLCLALSCCAALAEEADGDWLSVEDWESSEGDEDLEPLSEEELLRILADADEGGAFVVLPEDFSFDDENVFTLLMVGSDSYFADKRGRADAVILVQLNASTRTIRMVSFLRDLYVPIPGKGSNRLNASYIWGGHKLLRRVLENTFGVKADAYVEVNFSRMVDVVDAIGGIEVSLTEKEMTQVNSILRFYNEKIGDDEEDQLLWSYGENVHLTGKQALCFARIRKIDGDIQRTGRQRKVLEAAFRKVSALDAAQILQLVMANLDSVNTDISIGELADLAKKAMLCRNATFETLTIPAVGTYRQASRNGMSVVVADMDQNRELLWEFFGLD